MALYIWGMGTFSPSSLIKPSHIVELTSRSEKWRGGWGETVVWSRLCCLTTSSDRSQLAAPPPWKACRVKTADIIPQEAGKPYCKVRLGLQKYALIQMGPQEGLSVCRCWLWREKEKMLPIYRPLWSAGHIVHLWIYVVYADSPKPKGYRA